MRIDAYNSATSQVTGEAGTPQAPGQGAVQPGQADAGDRTTLSSDKTSLNSLVGQALNTPQVRQDKIDGLTQAINNGEYELDPAKIAASMIDEYA